MCECTKFMVDLDGFFWKPLPIISKHFRLRELISEKLQNIIQSEEGLNEVLNTELTTFEAVACTHLYVLTNKDDNIQIHIGMNSNEIECISYFHPIYKHLTFRHYRYSFVKEYKSSDNKFVEIEYVFSKEEYKEISTVSQELLDTILVQLKNGQIANKDGYKVET